MDDITQLAIFISRDYRRDVRYYNIIEACHLYFALLSRALFYAVFIMIYSIVCEAAAVYISKIPHRDRHNSYRAREKRCDPSRQASRNTIHNPWQQRYENLDKAKKKK